MLVRLSFTQNVRCTVAFRIIDMIIKTGQGNANTNVYSLASAYMHSSVYQYLDGAKSFIVRTDNPTNVKSHFEYLTSGGAGKFTWTTSHVVHDDSATKFYYQVDAAVFGNISPVYGSRVYMGDGSGISDTAFGNTANSVAYSYIDDLSTAVSNQARPRLTNRVPQTSANAACFTGSMFSQGAQGQEMTDWWFYITNNSLLWCASGGNTASGFPLLYNNANYFIGPFWICQYDRYDQWNTPSNGIIPIIMNTPRYTGAVNSGVGEGQPSYNHHSGIHNPFGLDPAYWGQVVYNLIDARYTNAPGFPTILGQAVDLQRSPSSWSNHIGAYTESIPSATTAVSTHYRAFYRTTTGWRFPNSDYSDWGIGLLPIRWRNSFYGVQGGNISSRTGLYWVSGEFEPGDVISFNNKEYVLFPNWTNATYNLGIAVPRE